MTDFITRLMRTHFIDTETVEQAVGKIEDLDIDAQKKLACDLADGKYGGIGGNISASHPLQRIKIHTYGRAAYGGDAKDKTRALILSIYPNSAGAIDALNRREAARIIVELDTLAERNTDARRNTIPNNS